MSTEFSMNMNVHDSQKIENNPNICHLTSEEMNKLWYSCIMD